VGRAVKVPLPGVAAKAHEATDTRQVPGKRCAWSSDHKELSGVLPSATDPEAAERLRALSEPMKVATLVVIGTYHRTDGAEPQATIEEPRTRIGSAATAGPGQERGFFAGCGFGRLITRWEDSAENFLNLVQLPCLKLSW